MPRSLASRSRRPDRKRPRIAAAAALLLPTGLVTGIAVESQAATVGCQVTYSVTSQWPGGFGGSVAITNLGSAINGWTLTWSFAAGQTVTQAWNATVVQSGSTVSAANVSYNASIPTNASVTFGFNGSFTASNPSPTTFALNGVTCTGVTSPSGSPSASASASPSMSPSASPSSSPTSGPPTVAADGTGKYPTIQAAIDAVPAGNTRPVTITIKPATYREIVTIPANKPYVTLQGLGSSASSTVIVNNRSNAGGYGTAGSATVFVYGHDFTAENLTISNDYGVGSQAVAANVTADRAVFNGVRFLGNQDTLLVNDTARAYFVNNYIEGTVDFIFGGGTAVFNSCDIYEKRTSGGPVTAARTPASQTYGLLIYKSTITGAVNNTTQLGRPWGPAAQVLYRESTLSATIATGQPWIDMSGNVWTNARFFEYKDTGPGATLNGNRPQMTDAQAVDYTPQKYLAGSDAWNPIG
ncbi:MAG TPA: pectinesterase family protein [Actinocrinis sp.]|nr:pectinesterase family protein [Actinocrinis sp.]